MSIPNPSPFPNPSPSAAPTAPQASAMPFLPIAMHYLSSHSSSMGGNGGAAGTRNNLEERKVAGDAHPSALPPALSAAMWSVAEGDDGDEHSSSLPGTPRVNSLAAHNADVDWLTATAPSPSPPPSASPPVPVAAPIPTPPPTTDRKSRAESDLLVSTTMMMSARDGKERGEEDRKRRDEFQALLNTPVKDLRQHDKARLVEFLENFASDPDRYQPPIVFTQLKREFNHGVPHKYLLSDPFIPNFKANLVAITMQLLIKRAEELINIEDTDPNFKTYPILPMLKKSAKQLIKLLRERALVFSTLPRSLYMASHIGSTWDNPTSQQDFEKMADLKGLSELLRSPNTTFGHSLCFWSDSLVEYLIQRVAWLCSIIQTAFRQRFSFGSLDHIDLCLILIFKDDHWSKNVKKFIDESTLWHYTWDFVPAFNASKGPKPVWPHHDYLKTIMIEKGQCRLDPTRQFPAKFIFKDAGHKVERLHLAPWDNPAALNVTYSKSDPQTFGLFMVVDEIPIAIDISQPRMSPVETSVTIAFQRLFFPHNRQWYCVENNFFSQPISKTDWKSTVADVYLRKFGLQLDLTKGEEPSFRVVNGLGGKKEYTAITVDKKQVVELLKQDHILFFFEEGWTNTIPMEAHDVFPFLYLVRFDADAGSIDRKFLLKIKDLRLEQCLRFFQLLYTYYGLSKRRFTMMCQLPFKTLNDREEKFYSELSALQEDKVKSKDFDVLESMLMKAGLDRTQSFSNVERDPSDAYYMLAERCYEINVKRKDLAGIAKAYLFFQKVHAHNIYYSYARYKMAVILLKYPTILGELSVFSRMLSDEKIKKKSLKMVYALLFNLCRHRDEESRYVKAHRLINSLLRGDLNPGIWQTFNAQTKAAFVKDYQLDEDANFPDVPGVDKKAEAESTKNILKVLFANCSKELVEGVHYTSDATILSETIRASHRAEKKVVLERLERHVSAKDAVKALVLCGRPSPNQTISVEEAPPPPAWTPAAAAAAAAAAPISAAAARAPAASPVPSPSSTNPGPPLVLEVTIGVAIGALLPSPSAVGIAAQELGIMRRQTAADKNASASARGNRLG